MPRRKKEIPELKKSATPEGRMNQLTTLAVDLAEEQLRAGTIAPSTLNVLLRYGTVENELALENLRSKNKLNASKVSQIETEVKGRGDSEEVLNALRGYAPSDTFD